MSMLPPDVSWARFPISFAGEEVRHLAKIRVSGAVLAMLLGGEHHYVVIGEEVPDGAQLVDAIYHGWDQMVDLYFEHPSFPGVYPGSIPTTLNPYTILTACDPRWGHEQPEWEIG